MDNKIKRFWDKHKDGIKNTVITVLSVTTVIGISYGVKTTNIIYEYDNKIFKKLEESLNNKD